jgi:uncharacterized membrane protein YvlD (DUF360 family)
LNSRLIPVIVIFLSPIIGILFAPTSHDLSSSILALGVWSFVTWCCLVMIAYWVYEDGKKIEPSGTYLWRHVKKLETSEKMMENLIEDLDGRIKKLEEKEKVKF